MPDAFAVLGRKLRLGVVGGGPGSFIGAIHRAAAQLDGRFDITAGVLSSDPARARAAAAALGFRGHGSVAEMLAAEPLDAVAIMTPNDRHFTECQAALAAGLHVVCDKPLTNTLAEASALQQQAEAAARVFCVTHAYSGYPMIRQARAMVAAGVLGALRAVQVEYLQAGMSAPVEHGALTTKLRWKLATARSGPSLVLGDIGTHAQHLACFVSGLPVESLCADLGALVPGRSVDDYGAFLLRFAGGVRGTMTVSQALAGTENAITLRVFGEHGHIEWTHARNNYLTLALQGRPVQILARGDADLLAPAKRLVRIARGHPEGFLEAFANLYRDAAEAMAARICGAAPDPLALDFPTAADGAAGLAFIEAALASRAAGGAWVSL
ncbi:Gfo/Idh/MocA family protein [Limobrevibacterium gyesilva]|uniref:Gfo/Idh/MocA family oxidoreductase n=1 Tax=Limobrevibacterium gyesilva TaxID=2991712 RepID=A0AA41YRP9_9PROT|nr:Gfo/Idh/MocA family oxidoreductase [Limobrevibacterium gyesilva]MCW3475285.1 Gfo/Idh/MocA family oxidoreductase [Limobrevibacterium gyesilva]